MLACARQFGVSSDSASPVENKIGVVLVERVGFLVNRGVSVCACWGFVGLCGCGWVDALLCGSLFGRRLAGRVFFI